jgi:GNAT superfamily N-acetyltransferase
MERRAYTLKYRFPALFRLAEGLARRYSSARYGRRVFRALSRATIESTRENSNLLVRALVPGDETRLYLFLNELPEEYLRFFRPHGFGQADMKPILKSRAFMTYGLFIEGNLAAYGLCKVAPAGSAYIGFIVAPAYEGRGIGSWLVAYLVWQAELAGLAARSTVSKQNAASIRCHEKACEVEVLAELENEHLMLGLSSSVGSAPVLSFD